MTAPDWTTLIRDKLAVRDSRIPQEWRLPESITSKAHRNATISAFSLFNATKLLTDKERHITEAHDATALLEKLATGVLSSLEVTMAFCKRASIAQQLINPLTEIFFDKALERAKECDAYLAQHGKPMGPFHGLPVSLKDVFMVKGEFATLGYVSYLEKPAADYNSVVVDMLLDGGAVLYCKTNVPQSLLVIESENRVFGCTLNVQRLCLTAGGSSSGEGALVGFRGSPLGVGSDIGGSIRCPSMLNGCFGFKPTANRLPYSGQQDFLPDGWPGITPTIGPHAHSARDLTLFCKSIVDGGAWERDAATLHAPWRDVPKRKLKIGLWMGVEEMPLSPPVSRILRTAADALTASGHTIILVTTPHDAGFAQITQTTIGSLNLDTNHTNMKFVYDGNEELIPGLAAMRAALDPPETATLDDVWKTNASRNSIRRAWHNILGKLDVIICPGSRGPGALHGTYGVPFYTLIWNLLDCPASVVPFSKADMTIDAAADGYDAEMMDGIAGSVQIVGWTGRDEEVLMATEVISDVLSTRSDVAEL